MKRVWLPVALCVCLVSSGVSAYINFQSKTSAIDIADGCGFVVHTKIPNCTGRIIKREGATITGNEIVFNQGVFEESANKVSLTGKYNPGALNRIVLDGDKSYRGNRGTVLQTIRVSGQNNRLEGDFDLNTNLVLLDANTTLTCALLRRLSQNIEMSGGTLRLDENLSFIDGKQILGSGSILGNSRVCSFGAKDMTVTASLNFSQGIGIELNAGLSLVSTWTFNGQHSVILGNGNVLDLGSTGKLVVGANSCLVLNNLVIKHVGQRNIACVDDTAKLLFQNVVFIQSNDFYFDKGTFEVQGELDLLGEAVFVFQPALTCTIQKSSLLYCDQKVTFSYEPRVERKNLLAMEDRNSILQLVDATLYITSTGMALTKGTFIADGSAHLRPALKYDGDRSVVEGLTFGDGASAANDCVCEVFAGATLGLETGYMLYKNVGSSAMRMDSSTSIFKVNAGATLYLYQPLNLDRGTLRMSTQASLVRDNGSAVLSGSLELFE